MEFIKEETKDVNVEETFRVKHEDTDSTIKTEFIKEETEDVNVEETFGVKHEDSDDDGIDLMAIIEKIQKENKKQGEDQSGEDQSRKDHDIRTAVKRKMSSPHTDSAEYRPRTVKSRKICVECGSSFKYFSGLKMHMTIHTGERLFTCPHCGKGFSKQGNFQQHLRVHTREKPYSCDKCGTRFSTQQKLKIHMKLHVRGRKRKESKRK